MVHTIAFQNFASCWLCFFLPMELFTRWTTHETNPNVPSGGRFEGKRKPLVTRQYPAGRQKAGQTSRMSFRPRLETRTPVPSCSRVQPSPPGLEGKAPWSSRADACRVLLNYWTARWQVFWRACRWKRCAVLTPSLSLWLRTWLGTQVRVPWQRKFSFETPSEFDLHLYKKRFF